MAEANVTTSIPQISFPFKIANISKLKEAFSPEVVIHGIPWKIKVKKVNREIEEWLSIFLHCAVKDKSPDWSHAAYCTFKLVNGNNNGNERQITPHVFDSSGTGFGFKSFIKWKDLFKAENNYVKDDSITFDITIVAADPNDKNPSKMLFETIEKSCDGSCLSKYRLNITNIDKLMAVRSPPFKMQGSFWLFTLCKKGSHLYADLENKASSPEFSCKVQISLKVVSSKKEIKSVEAHQTKQLQKNDILAVGNVVSWDELMKPENEFVNNNSIVIEAEIRTGLVAQDVELNRQNKAKRLELECAICLETINDQEVSSTLCGHLFCTLCIEDSIEDREQCPSCNLDVTLDSLHRVYLPIAN